MSGKRNKRIAPELTAEFNSTRQHPISVMTVKRKLISVGLKGYASVKKPLLKKENKVKRQQQEQQHQD